MLRAGLVALMAACGIAAALLLHTLISPTWLVATDAPIGALPFIAPSNTTISAASVTLNSYALGTLRYCTAHGGVCELKSRVTGGFAGETSCGRSGATIEALYIIVIVCAALATVLFAAAMVAAGRPAFTSDPARLGRIDFDVDEAAAGGDGRQATKKTEEQSQPPQRHVRSPREPVQGSDDELDGPALRGASHEPAAAAPTPRSAFAPAANRMSVQEAEARNSGNDDADAVVVTVEPASVTRAKMAARKQRLEGLAKRRVTRSAVPAVVAALLTWIATFIIFYMHESWLHCGAATVDKVREAGKLLGVAGATVERGASCWLLIAASVVAAVAVLLVPCLRTAAAGVAREQFDEGSDDDGEAASDSDDDALDQPSNEPSPPKRGDPTGAATDNDLEDDGSLSHEVQNVRSPAMRNLHPGHGAMVLESPDERDHIM